MGGYEKMVMCSLVDEYISEVAKDFDVPVTFPSKLWPGKIIKIELIDNP